MTRRRCQESIFRCEENNGVSKRRPTHNCPWEKNQLDSLHKVLRILYLHLMHGDLKVAGKQPQVARQNRKRVQQETLSADPHKRMKHEDPHRGVHTSACQEEQRMSSRSYSVRCRGTYFSGRDITTEDRRSGQVPSL